MKIAIIGTRGIPAKYGGFETFAQEISTRLVAKGVQTWVFCPNPQEGDEAPENYRGVNLKYMKTTKDASPMGYYFESVSEAIRDGFDAIVMCAAGGYAYAPHIFKRHKPLYITNTDGIEHRRTKWNKIVRLGYRFVGEMTSVILTDILVADSKAIKDYLKKEYRYLPQKPIYTIEYGANVLDEADFEESVLSEYGLKKNGYHLVVSRIEPENNVSMIIEGYLKSNSDLPLVVVGNLKGNEYSDSLKKLAEGKNVIFTGGVYDPMKLKALRIFCKSYLHGHSVGGTNPSLLEALGAGNIVIGHDNPFNREVTDNFMFYFASPEECATQIKKVEAMSEQELEPLKEKARNRIRNYYNWERIADEYLKLFNERIK